jgi:hypothetical protein
MWAQHVGETRNLVGKHLGKWSLGTSWKKLDDYIKINLKIGCEDGNWTELVQNHVQWKALLSVMLGLKVLLTEMKS